MTPRQAMRLLARRPLQMSVFAITIATSVTYAQQSATIAIDAAQIVSPVNRLIFGHNIEAADNARIFDSDTTTLDFLQTGTGFWDPLHNAPIPEVVNACKVVGMSMLRYPGGCLAHNFDWRESVGPDAKKNGWIFGVDEYLALCLSIGAEPMFTISDYALPADEMPENAAELVEYLNAPATSAHPWALKRKLWGHAEPYHVKWFELGNESAHGNHRVIPHRQYTPEEYAAYANATAAAMRAVDPSIKIGIVMTPGAGTDVENVWNRTAVRVAGKSADFIVVHLYAPHGTPTAASKDLSMQATMAVGEQSEHHLEEYRSMILRESGRQLPLAITEYNGMLDETTGPLRFSYGEALESADMIRVFLQPDHHVLTANYWQFLNGYFGMLRHSEKEVQEEPAFPLFRLWGQHFGDTLVKTFVDGPRSSFPGFGTVRTAGGDAFRERQMLSEIKLTPKAAMLTVSHKLDAGTGFAFNWQEVSADAYPRLAQFDALHTPDGKPLEYRLSFEARFASAVKADSPVVGLGLGDARGWPATHSGAAADGVSGEWRPFEAVYTALPDTKSIDFTARLQTKKAAAGTLEVRHLKITAFQTEHYPAYPLLTATASLSADHARLYVIVFNKSASADIAARIPVSGFTAAKARLWQVDGANLGVTDGVTETRHGDPLPVANGAVEALFPAHSMTAIELTP